MVCLQGGDLDMKSKLFALTSFAAVAVTCLAPVSASALSFNFSFDGVTGVISGLADNTPNEAATSVQVTSNTAGFGVGEYVGNPNSNQFSVSAGALTSVDFISLGANNASPAVTCCTLAMNISFGGISNLPAATRLNSFPVTYTPVAVPGPSPVLAFLA